MSTDLTIIEIDAATDADPVVIVTVDPDPTEVDVVVVEVNRGERGLPGDSHVPDPIAATDGAMLKVASGALVLSTTLDSGNLIIDGGIIE